MKTLEAIMAETPVYPFLAESTDAIYDWAGKIVSHNSWAYVEANIVSQTEIVFSFFYKIWPTIWEDSKLINFCERRVVIDAAHAPVLKEALETRLTGLAEEAVKRHAKQIDRSAAADLVRSAMAKMAVCTRLHP